MGYDKLSTTNGYSLPEATSALQKEIRRGNEVKAGYWAYELFQSGYSNHLWNRLNVIMCEDIGSVDVAVLVSSLRSSFEYIAKKSKTSQHWLLVAMAIRAMCQAAKTQVNNDFAYYVILVHEQGTRLPIPDYALDMHTQRGKAKGRGFPHFWNEAGLIAPRDESVESPYREAIVNASLGEPLVACADLTQEEFECRDGNVGHKPQNGLFDGHE